jgi:hypothetical protein
MIRLNWRNFLCALAIVLSSSLARAQSNPDLLQYALECDGENFSMCAQPLLKGEKAPFDGQLLTPELAISLSQRAMAFDSQLEIELERSQKLHDIEMNYQRDISNLDKEASKKQIKLLEKRLNEVVKIPWYQKPAFVAITSCVATVAVVIGAVFVIKAAD